MPSSYEEQHRQKWVLAAKDMALESFRSLVRLFVYYFDNVSRERYGVAQSVDLAARRVVVRLLPLDSGDGAPEVTQCRAYFGRPSWAPGQIVGKKVRVWQTEHITLGRVGPHIESTIFVIDDVTDP